MDLEQKALFIGEVCGGATIIDMLQSADKLAIEERRVIARMTPHVAPILEGSKEAHYNTFRHRCYVISEVFDYVCQALGRGEKPVLEFPQCSEELEEQLLNELDPTDVSNITFAEDYCRDKGISLQDAYDIFGDPDEGP